MQPETAFARIPDAALTETDPPLLYPDYVGTRLRAPKEPLWFSSPRRSPS